MTRGSRDLGVRRGVGRVPGLSGSPASGGSAAVRVNHVVYDTNIASLAVRGRMPAELGARLFGAVEVLAFVTVGELVKWSENDIWIAACCLSEGLPLITRNVKDFVDFGEHHGLVLITE